MFLVFLFLNVCFVFPSTVPFHSNISVACLNRTLSPEEIVFILLLFKINLFAFLGPISDICIFLIYFDLKLKYRTTSFSAVFLPLDQCQVISHCNTVCAESDACQSQIIVSRQWVFAPIATWHQLHAHECPLFSSVNTNL